MPIQVWMDISGNFQVICITWQAPDLYPQQLPDRHPRITRQDLSPTFYVIKTNILEPVEGLEGYLCLGNNILAMIYIVDTAFGTLHQALLPFYSHVVASLTLLWIILVVVVVVQTFAFFNIGTSFIGIL